MLLLVLGTWILYGISYLTFGNWYICPRFLTLDGLEAVDQAICQSIFSSIYDIGLYIYACLFAHQDFFNIVTYADLGCLTNLSKTPLICLSWAKTTLL